MPLPKAVRKQVEQAEADHKAVYEPQEAAESRPELTAVPEPQETPEEAQEAQEAQEAEETPAEASFETEGEPYEGGEPESKHGEEAEGKWEHKYRTLKGMFDSQVPKLQQENRQLKGEVDGIQRVLAAMQTQEAPPAQETPAQRTRRLRQEDVEAYGDDMIKVIRDTAYDEILPEIEKRDKLITELRQQLGGVTQRAAQSDAERVEAFLDTQVANWRDVNNDQEFHTWLGERDIFSGKTRQDLLNEAGVEHNAPRVASFFQAYLNETQAIRGTQNQAAAPVQTERKPKVEVSSLVSPGRPRQGGAGGAVDSEEPQVISQAQIAQFYKDVQTGKYRGREKDKEKTEQQIFNAVQRGLVT